MRIEKARSVTSSDFRESSALVVDASGSGLLAGWTGRSGVGSVRPSMTPFGSSPRKSQISGGKTNKTRERSHRDEDRRTLHYIYVYAYAYVYVYVYMYVCMSYMYVYY